MLVNDAAPNPNCLIDISLSSHVRKKTGIQINRSINRVNSGGGEWRCWFETLLRSMRVISLLFCFEKCLSTVCVPACCFICCLPLPVVSPLPALWFLAFVFPSLCSRLVCVITLLSSFWICFCSCAIPCIPRVLYSALSSAACHCLCIQVFSPEIQAALLHDYSALLIVFITATMSDTLSAVKNIALCPIGSLCDVTWLKIQWESSERSHDQPKIVYLHQDDCSVATVMRKFPLFHVDKSINMMIRGTVRVDKNVWLIAN